ncbi:hypothetical protein [Bifidobacterium cuniculi]|uniref:Uncharacterized protein n=1 Tax=Bifidobacterium cuniculi TaxID=1688 RepID=A0A087B4Z9_9BIFI|nr:hypothetical protein [Bifidobacterium cuniculi]KFI66099.1 hypothetical protein BCUN_0601 [Bifidobacterium cuniculi]
MSLIALLLAILAVALGVVSLVLQWLHADVADHNTRTLFDRTRTLHHLHLSTKHRVDDLEDKMNKIDEWAQQ